MLCLLFSAVGELDRTAPFIEPTAYSEMSSRGFQVWRGPPDGEWQVWKPYLGGVLSQHSLNS